MVAPNGAVLDNRLMLRGEVSEFLVLAGTNKAGSTAIFRYLGDHPNVAVSRQKESGFFYKDLDPASESLDEVRARYQSQFIRSGPNIRVFVEATPHYLRGGHEIASRIARVLPDAKLMFILRNPTDRVVSFFRSRHGQPHLPAYGLTSEEFVREAILAARHEPSQTAALSTRQKVFRQEIEAGHYAEFLTSYLEIFGTQRVLVTFFDQLSVSPFKLMREICRFAGIESDFYRDYNYRVENRTRTHRNAHVRRVAGKLNFRFEPFLNRFPTLRRAGRALYDLLNVDKTQQVEFSDSSRAELDAYFAPHNQALRDLMADNFPKKQLPDWLHSG